MRTLPHTFVLVLLVACGSGTTQPSPPNPVMPNPPSPEPMQPPNVTPIDPVSDADARTVGTASNQLAADLWARLRARRGNLAVSPASIWMALAMTQGGARGNTEAEMTRVLHLVGDGTATRQSAGRLLASWNDPARTSYTLRVVNRLFGEKTYTFEQPFVSSTRDVFRAPFEPVDFKSAAEAARAHINGWVAQQTQDRIRNLLPSGSLDDTTRLVLTNAVYFLAKWQSPFERESTHDQAFFVAGTTSANVPTMHTVDHFDYAQPAGAGVQVLQMPYRGNELAMAFVLPADRAGLPAVEARLDAATLDAWLGGLTGTRVIVSLPKFTVDPAESTPLAEILAAMGMPTAFNRRAADFTGIANPADPDERLFISNVFHKAFVKVDEEGTEAAAATAVVMAEAGAAPPSDVPPEFRADHPFLFFLRDLRSGAILFAGRVEDPRAH